MIKFLNKTKKILICMLLLFFIIAPNSIQTSAFAESEREYDKVYQNVFSYKEVFQKYYNDATEQLAEQHINMPITYEEFCEGYYSNEYDIEDYTMYVVEYIITNNDIFLALANKSSDTKSDSLTADYILKSTEDDNITDSSAFRRAPDYNGYDGQTFDYSLLKVGDMVFETKALAGIGHIGMIVDVDHDSDYGSYVQTVEAVNPKVSYGMLDDNRMVKYGVEILRVPTTDQNRQTAANFMIDQIGEDYSLNTLRLNKNDEDKKWYCSELCYAAYYNAGVDIGKRIKSNGTIANLTLGCLPRDIHNSYNSYEKCIIHKNFIDIELFSKQEYDSGSFWVIKIYNNTNTNSYIYYNSRMCFENDATNWQNLGYVTSTFLNANDSTTIYIYPNDSAKFVVFSLNIGNNRYITYANKLDNNPYKMSINYAQIAN